MFQGVVHAWKESLFLSLPAYLSIFFRVHRLGLRNFASMLQDRHRAHASSESTGHRELQKEMQDLPFG